MQAEEIADRLVEDPSGARSLLRHHGQRAGLSQAFASRVVALFAADHARLAKLGPVTRLVTRYGDDPAQGYRAQAIVARVKGRWSESASLFLAAGDAARTESDRLALKTGAIDALSKAGRVEEAVELARSIAAGLDALGETGLAARARLNLAYALMEQDRYEEAVDALATLPDRLREAGYSTEAASAHLALSTATLFGGEARLARREAEIASNAASEEGMDLLAGIARGNIAYADLLLGDADLALAELLRLRDDHRDEPVERARILEFLGDAYVAMNLWPEASDAYREAIQAGEVVSMLRRAHLRLGLGQSLLAAGSTKEALTELANAKARYRKLGNLPWQVAAETDIAKATGQRKRLAQTISLARQAGSSFHLCRALVVDAELGGPNAHLDGAEAILRRYPSGRLAWRVEAERARRAPESKKLTHFRRMFKAILADQARVSSFAGRAAYMRDKAEALQSYIGFLLSDPRPVRVREAVDAIVRSRAVALLDELLRAGTQELPRQVLDHLASVRESLGRDEAEAPTHGIRRRTISHAGLGHQQRAWLEETHALLPALEERIGGNGGGTILLASKDGIRAVGVSTSKVIRLEITPHDLARRLRWLAYDLLAPMANPDADPDEALCKLRGLGEKLVRPLLATMGRVAICPEDVLFRVPWLACLDAIGEDREFEIRLHPSLSGRSPDLDSAPPMLWVAQHADLPYAADEAAAFLGRFPNARVCRSAAEVRVCLDGGKASVLHVISHSRHQARHPMFSSLDFPDGPVLAAEIARSGLRADLVTLSGCDTGRISDINRLEPDGLVRAFLACGAGYVIGSAWPLDDLAASRLYASFYDAVVDGAIIHAALGKARREVQRWKGHPYYWASTLLYGGHSQ